MKTRIISGALAALALVGVLAGCGRGANPRKPSGTATASRTGVLPPVIVAADQASVSARVGDTIVFNVAEPTATTVSATPEGILQLTQGYARATAVFNPGARAIAPGKATVSITTGERTRTVSVTIK